MFTTYWPMRLWTVSALSLQLLRFASGNNQSCDEERHKEVGAGRGGREESLAMGERGGEAFAFTLTLTLAFAFGFTLTFTFTLAFTLTLTLAFAFTFAKAGGACGADLHIDLRVPKDVYLEYHKLVKKSEDNKNVVQSKTLPTKVAEIQRNSDNLYRALAYALAGTEMLHKATRTYVREYFDGFFGHLDKKQAQPWLDEFEVRSVRRQSEKVKDGKMGGLVELVAAAKKLNINILVYKTDKNQWLCMSPKTAHKADLEKKPDCQSKDMLTIALELYDNEHFDVILDVEQKK
uniref:OTU domain-containing protein n=1 Tax=Globodera pallida TaxID=36090 RepID=A0A183C169_GLOPA